MINIHVDTSGPIFDGRAGFIVDRMVDDIAQEVAQAGEDLVQGRLAMSLRHPTGRYQGCIRIENRGFATRIIDDSNIIYGPWLEGVGSRNRTTRFKGYASFRLAGQQLQRQAHGIASRVVDREVHKL